MLNDNIVMLKLIQLGLTLSNEQGNLAAPGAGKYCIWQFNVNEDVLPSDPIELLRGIPEQAEVPPVARAHASGQVANPSAQPPLPAQPAPVPSSGPNANLLDLSPQDLPDMGSNAAGGGNLDFLRNSPEFQKLRAMVQADGQLLRPMLWEMGKQNPRWRRLMKRHPAGFIRLIDEPIKGLEGNLLGQLASGMPQAITVTLEEREAIECGIPEQAGVPPVARAHASGQVANPPAQPPLPAQPAPVPSSGPNANLLDLSPQRLPDMGSNAAGGGNLDFLRNSQEFQHLRAVIKANPQLMQPMLRELGKLNLHLLRLIQENQADFVRLINEPIEGGEGNLLGQLASGMPQAITVTPEEREAIERGIPEQAGVPPVARVHASGQVANPPAQPAPVPSSGPNANLLDLSPQGLPDMGSNAAGGGNLDFLRNSQEFQHLRAMIKANPQLMQPMLQELGKLNLHLLRLIQEHQADFVRLINEPIEGGEGNLLGQLASGMPQAITVTPEEREAIEHDSGSPSNSLEPSHVEKDPIEATENDGNSNITCSTSPAPNLRSSFFAVNGVIFCEQSSRIGRACNLVALVGVTLPFTVLPKMLLHGNFSIPLRSSPCLKTSKNYACNVAVSAQSPANNRYYSISDEELESRGFNLHRSVADLNLDHLNSVFVAVGFPRRDPDKIRVALENTDSLLRIEYKKTQKPVAFARATGDGVFNAVICDVVVDPSFQGIGLGKAVMERMSEELLEKGITNIALYSEPRVLGFYRPLGFVVDLMGSEEWCTLEN
ncbi:hypothetical protein F0562_033934 [Nyssa sinensis]|uniref:N-acetyltransferase domain-containing protein n=1 Tax=Nyssa sinensis TaxID=561372 RepID=A0A5J5AIJ6_9ASTE|nr:hypothetical protein F0562_033934 [Nyssa sinensis]